MSEIVAVINAFLYSYIMQQNVFFKYKKICVIGAPGAGKTFFAQRLAEYLNRPLIHFDSVRFVNIPGGVRENSPRICQAHLKKALSQTDTWLAEGTAWQPWTEHAIAQCDIVIVVRQSLMRRARRIVWRWLVLDCRHWKLKSMINLIRISAQYDATRLPVILARAEKHSKKVVFVSPTIRDNRRMRWRVTK